MKREITILRNRDDLAAHAAAMIVRTAHDAIASRGRAMLALCGGTTPEATYALLAQSAGDEIDWERIFLFFTDERFVPVDDPANNFGRLRRTLLVPAAVDAKQVFAIPTQLATANDAAAAYEDTLAREFGIDDRRDHPPRFDLTLLGLGEDGHTASLFPEARALSIDRWVVASPPPSFPPRVERITLTFPVLNAAREVLFLVSGSRKAAALRAVFTGTAGNERLPAARIQPSDGTMTWLVDQPAASQLQRPA